MLKKRTRFALEYMLIMIRRKVVFGVLVTSFLAFIYISSFQSYQELQGKSIDIEPNIGILQSFIFNVSNTKEVKVNVRNFPMNSKKKKRGKYSKSKSKLLLKQKGVDLLDHMLHSNTSFLSDKMLDIKKFQMPKGHILTDRNKQLQEKILNFCGKGKKRQLDDHDVGHYRWLFASDKLKVVFCVVPKVASTYFKQLLTYGLDQNKPFWSVDRPSLDKYNQEEIDARLKNYLKVMFVRDPIERLWSAYTSKLLMARGLKQEEFNAVFQSSGKKIKGSKRKNCHHTNFTLADLAKNIKQVRSDRGKFNPHWDSYFNLCHPCEIKYDFVGRLEHFQDDLHELLSILDIPVKKAEKSTNISSSYDALIEAGCRLNWKFPCSNQNKQVEVNLKFLLVEGMINEKDITKMRETLKLWHQIYSSKGPKTVRQLCVKHMREKFILYSEQEAKNLILNRKAKLRTEAFDRLDVALKSNIIRHYQNDLQMFGYNSWIV